MSDHRKHATPPEARAHLKEAGWSGDKLVRGWCGDVAPGLCDKTVDFVFGDVYGVSAIPPQYRELIITAIIAAGGGIEDGLVAHAELATKCGATPAELDELFTLVAAYAGFPKALGAARAVQHKRERTHSK